MTNGKKYVGGAETKNAAAVEKILTKWAKNVEKILTKWGQNGEKMGKKWGKIPRKYFAILFVFFWFRGGVPPSFAGQGFIFAPLIVFPGSALKGAVVARFACSCGLSPAPSVYPKSNLKPMPEVNNATAAKNFTLFPLKGKTPPLQNKASKKYTRSVCSDFPPIFPQFATQFSPNLPTLFPQPPLFFFALRRFFCRFFFIIYRLDRKVF